MSQGAGYTFAQEKEVLDVKISETVRVKQEDISLSDESLILEISDRSDTEEYNEDSCERVTEAIEFIDTNASLESSENAVSKNKKTLINKKKVFKEKRKLSRKKNTVAQEKKITRSPRKFRKIAAKFYLHNLLELYCQKCDMIYQKVYGKKMTNCQQCNERLYYQCIKCTKRYRNYCDITMHLKYDCGKPKGFMCKMCEFRTSRKYRLDDHCKSVHTFYQLKDLLNCAKCGKAFKLMKYLRWHQNNECGIDQNFHCPNCDFKTKYANSLRKHILNIHNRNENVTYACEKCGKDYKTKGALLNHVRNLCGKEPGMRCEHCNYRAYQKYPLLANHIQRNHPHVFPKDAFMCKHCFTDFHCIYGLNRHMRQAPICAQKESAKKSQRKCTKVFKRKTCVGLIE